MVRPEAAAEAHVSVTDVGEVQEGSDAKGEEAASETEMVRAAAVVSEGGEVQGVSDRAETATADHRRQVPEVMSVAITLEALAAVEVAPDTVQVRVDLMTVQEAPRAADSKLKIFSDYL